MLDKDRKINERYHVDGKMFNIIVKLKKKK